MPKAATPARTVRMWLLVVMTLAIVAQFYFAGRGVFGASSFETHKTFGHVLEGLALLIVLASAVPKELRNPIDGGLPVLLLVLVFVQTFLADAKNPDVEAFHPVNAIVITVITLALLGRDRRGP
jgi:hypothetical protein